MAKSIARNLADVASPTGVLDGTLSTAAQTNITSVGTLSSLTVSGNLNATLTTAAQGNITSLGTLTALTVDNLGINGNTITANSGALNLTPASGSAIVLDGTINVDAGVVTGATSITSTAFVGGLTGNVTGNVSGTAATVTGAAQTNITSVGTLTSLALSGNLTGKAVTLAPDTAGKLTIRLTTNAANDGRIVIRSDTTDKVDIQANGASYFNGGNVGIGETTPLGTLHVKSTDSGATADASADDLVIENNSNTGISILSGTSSTGSIYFGDSDRNWDGYIAYSHGTSPTMTIASNGGGNYIKLDATGSVGFSSTPTSWSSGYKSIQIGDRGFVGAHTGSDLYVGQNAYFDSAWKYEASVAASMTQHSGGQITHKVAAAGTANNAITWTNALHIDSGGTVLVGGATNTAGGYQFKVGHSNNQGEIGLYADANGADLLSYDRTNAAYNPLKIHAGAVSFTRGNQTLSIGTTVPDFRVNQMLGVTSAGARGGVSISSYHNSAAGPIFDFNISRNVSPGSHTVVQTDDALGTFIFRGDDGDEFIDSAAIECNVDAAPGNGDMPGRLVFYTSPDGTTGLQERLRIDNAGAVLPGGDATQNLGSAGKRWDNLYVNDMHFSNEGSDGNEVDGTTGDWTLQEGEEHLYIINNKSGKKFKFSLEEIE